MHSQCWHSCSSVPTVLGYWPASTRPSPSTDSWSVRRRERNISPSGSSIASQPWTPCWCVAQTKTDNQIILQIISPQVINASSNFLIYLFAGVSFRSKFQEVFRLSQCSGSGNRQEYQTNSTSRYKRFSTLITS